MLSAEKLHSDGQSSEIKFLGLIVFILCLIDVPKVFERSCCCRMLRPQRFLMYIQRSYQQRFSFIRISAAEIDHCEVVERNCDVRIIWTQRPFKYAQRSLVECFR